MQTEPPVERLRLVFTRGEEVAYISHLDIMRMWERILRRAEVPLAYSHGFNPQPRIALAAPLPVGVLSDSELMDVYLDERMSPREFLDRVIPQLPAGIRVPQVVETPLDEPSLQSRLRYADYEVSLRTSLSRQETDTRIQRVLGASELLRERRRDNRVRRYDLRPLISTLWVKEWDTEQTLEMRLRNDESGAGRPEEVMAELGLQQDVQQIRRLRLLLESEGLPH